MVRLWVRSRRARIVALNLNVCDCLPSIPQFPLRRSPLLLFLLQIRTQESDGALQISRARKYLITRALCLSEPLTQPFNTGEDSAEQFE